MSTTNEGFVYRVYRTDATLSLDAGWGAEDGRTFYHVYPVSMTINEGTLTISNAGAISTNNAIRVQSNATLDVSGVDISNPIRLDNSSTLTNSSSSTSVISGSIVVTDDTTVNGSGDITLSGMVNLPEVLARFMMLH